MRRMSFRTRLWRALNLRFHLANRRVALLKRRRFFRVLRFVSFDCHFFITRRNLAVTRLAERNWRRRFLSLRSSLAIFRCVFAGKVRTIRNSRLVIPRLRRLHLPPSRLNLRLSFEI